MAILGRDDTGYGARPMGIREDMNGTQHIYARAHASLTALQPYVARLSYDGWRTLALFDSGMASTTAASHLNYFPFVPITAIASDTDGWGQIGGPIEGVGAVSQSQTTGNVLIWADATLTGSTAASATVVGHSVYGIVMATASSGTHDLYLRGVNFPIVGQT